MSLQVWLPLRGDLNNQGLNPVSITNTSATINNSGKIGKCYQFGTGLSYMDIPKEAMNSCTTEASMCFFIKILTWNKNYATFFQAGKNAISWTDYTFGLLRNNAASTCCFTISNGSSASYASYLTPTLELNRWYHIALIYKTGHCLIYIDGQLHQDYTTSIVPNFSGITRITLGTGNNRTDGYQTNCQMNDFRIYDHALSAKEVEEISKGLILHYKLDYNFQQLNNCYSYPTFNTSTATGGWSHWGSSGHGGSYGQTTDRNFIFNKNQTYAHWITNTASSTGYYILYQSPAFNGGYRSLQVILKQEDSAPIQGSGIVPGWNDPIGNHPLITWDSIIYLGNGFYLCKCEGFQQGGSNNLVSISIPAKYGKKLYVSEMYLENDKTVCSDIFNQDNLTIAYDCSGYKNNGTPVGTLAAIKPSPRYESATNFPASGNNYIRIGNQLYNARDEMTVNLWAKADDWTSSSKGVPFSSVESGGIGWQVSNANYEFYCGTGASSNTYKSINVTVNNLSAGWHMLSATYDGLTLKVYTDGELKGTTAANSSKVPIWYNNNSGMFISGESSGSLTAPNGSIFRGAISDIRVYATALTADQIKELYNTSMAIDSNGNIMAREIQE